MRHVKFRKLVLPELYLDIASVCYFSGIIYSLRSILKKLPHLLFRFEIIIPALVAHPVLIRYLFLSLDAQKYVVGFGVLFKCIMAVIRRDQIYSGLI